MPLDPVSAGIGGLQSLVGLGQMIFSGRKKAEKQLNKLIDTAPKYQANKSILDYYNTALQRYGVDPAQSAMYKRNMQSIDQDTSSGIAALGDRRMATAGLSSLLRAKNDAKLNTEVAAENERNRRFGELGSATNMKAGEERYMFENNELMPFDMRAQVKAQKLQGANQRSNAGMSNLFGGASTLLSGYSK